MTVLSYTDRANYCLSTVGKRLLTLMDEKETNLALSADVTTADELLTLAQTIGEEICLLKTHIDIVTDYTPALSEALRKLAQKHHFMLFEDRKFADIGNTVKLQYEGGIYKIANWADIVNAHTLTGPGVVRGLADIGRKKNRGLLLIAEVSSAGHLLSEEYRVATVKIAEQFADFVIGFITQRSLSNDPHWINFTPGVKAETKGDKLGQQYVTPEVAILERGADVIIVGRGIIADSDPIGAAQLYRERGWQSYLTRRGIQ